MLGNPIFGQSDSVYITPTPTSEGSLRFDFPVSSFEDIVCLQYTMNYDTNFLSLVDIENFNLPDLNANSFGQPVPGKITFSWFDSSTTGVTEADGESIYSVQFNSVGTGFSDLYIDGSLTPVEACNSTTTIPLIFNNVTILAIVTSNEDIATQNKVNVFPNPATDQITFDVPNLLEDSRLEVYNNVGQLVISRSINDGINILSKAEIVNSGIYHYRIFEDDKSITSGKFTLL